MPMELVVLRLAVRLDAFADILVLWQPSSAALSRWRIKPMAGALLVRCLLWVTSHGTLTTDSQAESAEFLARGRLISMNLQITSGGFRQPARCRRHHCDPELLCGRARGRRAFSVAEARERVVPALRDHPTALVLLAFADEAPIGIAVGFFGFSTFRARPLLNIHDLAVLPAHRGKGVGRALLSAAEEHARRHGCCRLTLEVLESNSGSSSALSAVRIRRHHGIAFSRQAAGGVGDRLARMSRRGSYFARRRYHNRVTD